jgi:hypothetical protein
MDCGSFGFDRVRSRPAKIIKGMKKAAYYPKMRNSPQSLARHLASPLFLLAASSYHEVLTVAQLDKADAACAEADAARPDEGFLQAVPRPLILCLLPPPHPPTTFCAGTAPKPVAEAAGSDETSFSLLWRGVSLLYKTRTTPGRVLNSRAVHQGQPRIKRGLCFALVGALELLSDSDWDILIFHLKFRIRILESRHQNRTRVVFFLHHTQTARGTCPGVGL